MLQYRSSQGAAASGRTFALVCLLWAGSALAVSEDEHREHGAHEHGRGTLDIAVEGEELVVEFRIPAANVVGFEHVPRDDAEREAVQQALAPFQDAASLLVPSAEAECELEMLHAGLWSLDDLEEGGEGEAHGHEEHEHEEHAHEEHEEHEEEEHDEHGHEEHEHEEEGHDEHEHEGHEHGDESAAEAHSELRATYHFHCHAPEKLSGIEVRVFEHLIDADEIDVRVVTSGAQGAMELHPPETRVELVP